MPPSPSSRSLFGWTKSDLDMGEMGTYSILEAGGASFGGAMSMDPSAGHPSHFIGYIYCEDVDAIAARAPELGGQVPYPPMDIPGVGRFAVLQDPMGAHFSALSTLPTTAHAPETDIPYGCVSWSELTTDDPEKSGAFYSQLFSWEQKASRVAEMPDYTIFTQGESMLAGLWKADQAGMPSAWTLLLQHRGYRRLGREDCRTRRHHDHRDHAGAHRRPDHRRLGPYRRRLCPDAGRVIGASALRTGRLATGSTGVGRAYPPAPLRWRLPLGFPVGALGPRRR